jgi:hypothetical protein
MPFKIAIRSYKTIISFRVGAHFVCGGQREGFHMRGDSANDASAMFGHNSEGALIGEENDASAMFGHNSEGALIGEERVLARGVTHTAIVRGS